MRNLITVFIKRAYPSTVFVFTLFIYNPSIAQLNLNWAYSFGSSNANDHTLIYRSALNDKNGIVIFGECDSTVDLDPGSGVANLNNLPYYNSNFTSNNFIAQYDSMANLQFVRLMADTVYGSYAVLRMFKILCDKTGNIYFLLTYLNVNSGSSLGMGWNVSGNMITTDIPSGMSGSFILKFDDAGNCLYAKSLGFNAEIRNAVIDNDNNLIYMGDFKGTTDLDPGASIQNFTATYEDAYLTKLDTSGNVIFIKIIHCLNFVASGMAEVGPMYIVTDTHDNIYFTLAFYGLFDFDPGAGLAAAAGSYNSNTPWNVMLVKWDSSGSYIYKKGFYQTNFGINLKIDPNNNLYLWGSVNFPTDIDPGPSTTMLYPANGWNVLANYSDDGNLISYKQFSGVGHENRIIDLAITGDKLLILAFDKSDSASYSSIGIPSVGNINNFGKELFIVSDTTFSSSSFQVISESYDSIPIYSGIITGTNNSIYLVGSYIGVFDADFNAGVHNLQNLFANQYTESGLISKYLITAVPLPVGIMENEEPEIINIYPNPFYYSLSVY